MAQSKKKKAARSVSFVCGYPTRTPIVAFPRDACPTWRDEAGISRAAAAREACNAKKPIAFLSFEEHTAIVLGPRGTCTTWVGSDSDDVKGGIFARWIDARGFDHENVVHAARAVPEEKWRTLDEKLVLARDTQFALFAASVSEGPYGEERPFGPLGKEGHPFGWVSVPLRGEEYAVDVVDSFTDRGVTLQLIRLRAGPRARAVEETKSAKPSKTSKTTKTTKTTKTAKKTKAKKRAKR